MIFLTYLVELPPTDDTKQYHPPCQALFEIQYNDHKTASRSATENTARAITWFD